jgi:hypothetical protein
MPRFAVPCTVDELKSKIGLIGDIHTLSNFHWNDFKVEFDFENFFYDAQSFPQYQSFLGYHALENGLTFLGCCAGGDWEAPVYFVLYCDGKKLRAYIPTKGNTYSLKTKQAFGNCEDDDSPECDADNAPEPNIELMLEDIRRRILVKI